jgi:DNA-binding FadR family transcriptional regulator
MANSAPQLQAEPVRLPKAAVVVADQLRRSIVRGEFQPGDALPNETELMALYGVSRPVVREGLRIIESESLIAVKRGVGGGARVTRPDIRIAARHTALLMQLERTTLADVYEALLTLEPDAVRRLATQRPAGAIRRLRELHDAELALVDDPVAYPVHAARFHEELIELAGNKTLAILSRQLFEIVERVNRATFASLAERAHGVADVATHDHAELIALIEAGDVESADALWRRHLEGAAAVALERFGPTTVVDILDD